MTYTFKPLLAAAVLAVGLGLLWPGSAEARPKCNGTLGACAWTVEPDTEIEGLHWFLLDCGEGGMWSPISNATATAYCSYKS